MKIETLRLSDLAKSLVGKTLVRLEFGSYPTAKEAEDRGGRHAPLPQKISDAYIGTTEGDRDPCIYFELEDGTEVYAYDNEEITFQ
jgi:hypothetical protein